mmetsp:Transcript_2412/g.5490  ORF Transcript_2412/g.5490 Transcript_2412/m.5490 type:complete len:772 (-) Transcript_2412:482-2797(-)
MDRAQHHDTHSADTAVRGGSNAHPRSRYARGGGGGGRGGRYQRRGGRGGGYQGNRRYRPRGDRRDGDEEQYNRNSRVNEEPRPNQPPPPQDPRPSSRGGRYRPPSRRNRDTQNRQRDVRNGNDGGANSRFGNRGDSKGNHGDDEFDRNIERYAKKSPQERTSDSPTSNSVKERTHKVAGVERVAVGTSKPALRLRVREAQAQREEEPRNQYGDTPAKSQAKGQDTADDLDSKSKKEEAKGDSDAGSETSGTSKKTELLTLDPRDKNEREEVRIFGVKKTGINFDKYNDVQIECSGEGIPDPVLSFEDAQFHTLLQSNISLAGFKTPTPVQKYSIPICQNHRDLMACAQTGSGKTGGFLFPILQRMLEDSEAELRRNGSLSNGRYMGRGGRRRYCAPGCLILSPTRELALQINKEAQKFCYRTPLKTVCVYGGEDIYHQVRQLESGCDLVIATPGRLVDLISRRKISMSAIKYLCFDEADRMLDMGFEPQIRQIIQDSDMPEKEYRQTLMFSATFPTQIQSMAQDFLKDYIFLSVGRVGATCSLVTQKVMYVEDRKKKDALMRVLPQCTGLTLIFVERKRSADEITAWLIQMGVDAISIHGDRSQQERKDALEMFKSGRCPILVATDVAARGLDIDDVTDVINFDMPSSIDTYVHRIGRTGRCGRTGTAVTFVNEGNKNVLQDLFHSLKESKQETPDWFVKLYRKSGTLKSSYRGSGTRFGGSDIRREKERQELGKPQTGMGRRSAPVGQDGWGDSPKASAADGFEDDDGWD